MTPDHQIRIHHALITPGHQIKMKLPLITSDHQIKIQLAIHKQEKRFMLRNTSTRKEAHTRNRRNKMQDETSRGKQQILGKICERESKRGEGNRRQEQTRGNKLAVRSLKRKMVWITED